MSGDCSIKSLEELVKRLNSAGDIDEFSNIVSEVKLDFAAIEKYCRWSDDKYHRILITRCDDYELLLLCWNKGQHTPVHDHAGQRCWMCGVLGKVREARYAAVNSDLGDGKSNSESSDSHHANMKLVEKIDVGNGDFTYIDDNIAYHRISNIADENNAQGKSVTVHLYAKPIDRCNIYDIKTGKIGKRDMVYDYKFSNKFLKYK